MRPLRESAALALFVLAAPLSATAQVTIAPAAPPAVRPAREARPSAPLIGTPQIDRFDAIQKEQAVVAANPKALADWIILGELAHEVAMDVPSDIADKYYVMSRNAFESALALDPDNPGLKAAVQFARDQQASAATFEQSRDAATDTFLAARRRDLAAMRNTPSVRVVSVTPTFPPGVIPRTLAPTVAVAAVGDARPSPATPAAAARQAAVDLKTDPAVNASEALTAPRGSAVPVAEGSQAVTPARELAPSTDSANMGVQLNYSSANSSPIVQYEGPVGYRPFYGPNGSSYTFKEFSGAYYPTGVYTNPASPAVTMQRFTPAVRVTPNAFEQQILNKPVPPR
jgi:hypothetical protein